MPSKRVIRRPKLVQLMLTQLKKRADYVDGVPKAWMDPENGKEQALLDYIKSLEDGTAVTVIPHTDPDKPLQAHVIDTPKPACRACLAKDPEGLSGTYLDGVADACAGFVLRSELCPIHSRRLKTKQDIRDEERRRR